MSQENTNLQNIEDIEDIDNVEDIDDIKNSAKNDAKKDVFLINQFTASCVALLKLLRQVSTEQIETIQENKNETENDNSKELQAYVRFNESVDKYIKSLQDNSFDFPRVLRKIFDVLKSRKSTTMITEKDPSLFQLRNEKNKIVSILPGINIILVFPLLSEKDTVYFWQYFHLMTLSTFTIFNNNNPEKVSSKQHIMTMIKEIGASLNKTGIMVNNKIFNPYLGLGSDESKEYDLDEMFAQTDELQTGENLSLESVLGTLGIGNLINEKDLNEKLGSLKESDLKSATDQIVDILGASGDSNTRNVCDKLVRNIVDELKINGIANVGNVLQAVAQKSRSEINIDEMKNTMGYVQNFMKDGKDKLKNMKDENGNPVGEQVLNSFSAPMAMMNAMNSGQTNDSAETQNGQNGMPDMASMMAKMMAGMSGMNKGNTGGMPPGMPDMAKMMASMANMPGMPKMPDLPEMTNAPNVPNVSSKTKKTRQGSKKRK
jgi:hypothetical protein